MYGYISEVVGGPTVNRPSIRRLALPPLLRGALVVVIGVGVSTCRLDRLLSGPAAASLCQGNDSVTIRAAKGSTTPQKGTFLVANCGDGSLDWMGQIHRTWASLVPDSGAASTSGTDVTVRADPAGMDTGEFFDTAVVNGVSVSTQLRVPVKFIIHDCTPKQIVPDQLYTDTLNAADCAAPHRANMFAQIFSFSGTANDIVSIEVNGGFDGYVALDTSLTPSKPPLAQSDDCLGQTGNPCLPYVTIPSTGTYFVEVTSHAAGDTGLFTVEVAHPRNPNSPDPASLDQRLDATRSIVTGSTIGQDSVVLFAVVSDSDPGDTLHVQAEIQQTPSFTGIPNCTAADSVLTGQTAHVSCTNLTNHKPFYWRIRVVDQTNRPSGWVAHGGSPDFAVAISQPPANVSSATLSQFQANDSVSSYGVGAVVPTDTIVLAGQVSDPDPGDSVRLMVEVKPTSQGFSGTATDSSARYTGSGGGSFAKVRVGPLPNNTNYHWQAWAEDQTGRVSLQNTSFGGNNEGATDFRIQVAHPPDLPASLGQFQTDLTPILVGDTANQGSVVFQGTVSDVDGGNVSLNVEVKPIGTSFTDSASGTSTPVPSGQVASLSLSSPIIQNGQCYHWQAQALDPTSRTSGWTSFGANPEIANDFCVALPVTQLVFTQQPSSAVAGAHIAPPILVTARNALNQTVTSFDGPVTIGISTNPGGGTLNGTLTVNASSGVATFNDLSINKTGTGYKLTATALSFQTVSNAFNITPGPAARLAFTTQPTSTPASATITPAVQVSAQDADSNFVPTFTGSVTLAIPAGRGDPSATLSGTNPVSAVAGVATFSNLSIDKTGGTYTLRATSGSLTPDTSNTFSITGGPIATLTFTTPPSTTTAGAVISPAVVVTAKDAAGNVANFNGPVTLAIGTNPGGGTLLGTNPVNASGGVAVFSNLRIRQAGLGYTLTASATGAPTITSGAFNINAGTATQLHFTTQPTTTADSARIDSITGVVVTAFDSTGLNVATTFTGTVRMNITPGTGTAGAGLLGTLTQPAVAGVARFTDLRIHKLGTAYQLTASVSGGTPTSDDSQPFDIIVGPAKALFFTVDPPASTVANVAMNPAVQVTARDAAGNTVTAFGGSVTLTITSGTGTPGAILSGGVVSAVSGVATFSNLSIDKAGNGYTLTANSGALTQDVSTPFTILPAGPDPVKSTIGATSPITACKTPCSGGSLSTITVTAKDAAGNPVPGATVTISSSSTSANITQPAGLTNGSGVAQGTISDTTSGLQTVSATIFLAPYPTVSPSTPASLTVNPAAAAAVFFIRNPLSTTAGATINNPGTGIQVQVNDQFGNRVSNATNSVGLEILIPPSPAGTLLGAPNPKAAVTGVATFSNLSIAQAGMNYFLRANSAGLASDTSTPFNISPGAASKLGFVQQPTSANAGATITPVVTAEIEDVNGNRTSSTANVTLAITSGTGTTGAHLSGGTTVTVAAVNGLATFSTLSIDSAGTGYTLSATSGSLTGATSSAFTINAGTPSKLAFGQQPTSTTAGVSISPAVTVRILDAVGNLTAATSNVTLAITSGTGTAGAHLSGGSSVTVAAVGGVATFGTLNIDSAGPGYTLSATSGSLTGATSSGFTIIGGAASRLGFGQQPTIATAGANISPAVTVRILDALGNLTSATNNVTLAITSGTGTAGAHLSGGASVTVAAVSGVATFSTLSIDSVGTSYTLSATSGVLTGATSNAFNTNAGSPSKLALGQQPTGTTGGATISPPVTVRILDALGNLTSSTSNVTLAITGGTGTAGAHLSGGASVTVAAVSGVATFSTLSIDSAGTTGYTLSATSGVLTGATSSSFTISVGAATKLGFRVQPPNNPTGGVPFSTNVQVEVRDAGGNRVTSASTSIQLSLNGGDAAASLSGSNPVSAASGLATFFGLSVDSAANFYTLVATGGGLTQATSTPFNVTVGPAAKLGFHIQPTNTVAGASITPIVVEIEDAGGNRVTSGGPVSVGIAILNNTGGGTLSGTTPKNSSNGLATFSNLSIDKTGVGYTLRATSGSLTAAISSGFDITPAAADHLAFIVQPSSTLGGQTITPAVVVEVRDQFDNRVTGATTQITVDIGTNPGTPTPGTLAGTVVVNAVSGQATFGDLSIDNVGVGYTLTASAASLTGATSDPFDIL